MITDNKIYATAIWPYRLIGNFLLLGFVWLLTLGVITIRHNLVGKQIDSLLSEIYSKTAVFGWGLDDVTIEGRDKTSKESIINAINLKRGDNILEIDLPKLHTDIMKLPWIKSVTITRRYFPNTIHISVTEKQVQTIWQYNNEFYPIDEDGQIIETEYVPQKELIVIIGQNAPENFNRILYYMKKDKELFARLKAANFISSRRWNLIFDDIENGITVKMPEDNFEAAWKKLVKLDKTRGILKRKLTFIDLRLRNKVIVRLNTSNNRDK